MSAEHDPVDLQANDQRDAELQAKARKAKRQEAEDWTWFMDSPRGRRIVWGLLEQAGVYRTSMAENPHQTSFNEGSRNVGLRIIALIGEHCPEQMFIMSEEAKA